MKRLAVVLFLVGVVAGTLVVLVSGGGSRGPSVPSSRAQASEGTTPQPSEPSAPRPLIRPRSDPTVEAAPVRERLPREPLSGRLREAGGEALLTWTALLPELEGLRSPGVIDYDRLRAASVSTRSDSSGAFTFPAVPEGALLGESVVWITRPGREASSIVLAPPAGAWSLPEREAAPAREVVRVRVRRAGEVVAGASVRHVLSFWSAGPTDAEKRARRVFLRETLTDSDGSAEIVPGSRENFLLAWYGAERSIAWIGEPEPGEEIVLELLPTIEVSGRIVVEEGPGLELERARYSVGYFSAEDGTDFLWGGASMAVRSDGGFGPDPWPRGDRRQLQVYAAGGEMVPARVVVFNPPPGKGVEVELVTRRGHPFEVAVTTPEGEPVQGALLAATHWDAEVALPLARETTPEDGRVIVHAPAGELIVEVQKPGFTSRTIQQSELVLVPQVSPPLRVVLRPSGVVEGLVRRGSDAVPRFSVLAWNDDASYYSLTEFEDEEGAFRLADVPMGETVHLLAYSEALPQSDTVAFVLEAEELELELELPEPRKASGRVIDSVSREPIPSARIQHLLTGVGGLADYRGREMPVQPDGRFELDGFFPGRGGFVCTAEGYDGLFYNTREDDSDVIDVGLLALSPLAVLAVQAREAGVDDFSAYKAWNRANATRTPVPLAADGTLRIPSRSGHFQLFVARPDGSVSHVCDSLLPGEEKRVVVDFSGGIELAVLLEEAPADVETWTLCASTRSGDEARSVKARWSSERLAFVLRGLGPGDAVLELRDGEGELVVQRSHSLSDARQQTLTLAQGGERHHLRLVDGRGDPWASRPVTVTLGDASGWSVLLETDARGELAIGPLDARRVFLSAKLGNESLAYGIEVDLEPDPARTTEIEIDVGPRSMLRLSETGQPVVGLGVIYSYERGPRQLDFGYISDEAGLVRGPFLAPGVYTLRTNHRDFWPTRYRVTSRDDPEPDRLELYSRSTLAIEVTTLAGRPIRGARLDLAHAELAESADAWLAAGTIQCPTGLATDAEGRLVLRGIPRGTYAWTCTTPGGGSGSGEVGLAARASQELSIRIEED